MRIKGFTVSPVAFYSEPLWNLSIGYRVFLLTWRLLELGFVTVRFLFIRAPFLLIWTRLPVTKDITLPGSYKELQPIFVAERGVRLGLQGGKPGGAVGTIPFLDQFKSPEEMAKEQEFLRRVIKPPTGPGVVIGSVVRGLITELGSLFIKFAQIMSMRPELPPFLREELAAVQDKLPGLREKEVRTIIERELMRPVEDVFEWVNFKPVASASLACVYHAKLRDGREVALKVQRPFLQGIVATDTIIILRILLGAIKLVLPQVRKTDLTFFTLSFESSIKREINFELEGHVQDKCRQAVQASEQTAAAMVIAEVYFDYTTTKLLTMEFIHDFLKIDEIWSLPPEELWDLVWCKVPGMPDDIPIHFIIVGCRFPMQLQWEGEVFHGDLHLGNLYILKPRFPGDRWRFFLCDFGMFEDIPRMVWRNAMIWLWGLLFGQAESSMDGMKALHVEAGGKLGDVDWDTMMTEFQNFQRSWIEPNPNEQSGVSLRRSKLHEGGLTRQLLSLLFGRIVGSGLRLPYWLWLLLKSYLYLEETGMSVVGGSYDWSSWIFDQYFARAEKDAVLATFDSTNVFTQRKTISRLESSLPRGDDYNKVLEGLLDIQDEIRQERLNILREEAKA